MPSSNVRRSQGRQPSERGVALVYTALAAVTMCAIVGLAIDVSVAYLLKQKLSMAVDAAALAGARSLSRGADLESQRANATSVAERFFSANFAAGTWAATSINRQVVITEDNATRIRSVHVTGSVTAPLYFLRMIGRNQVTVATEGEARRRDVNIVLILDRSSSMVSGNAIPPMKAAAQAFVDRFASGRDRLGLVVFGGSYITAFRPDTTFKTAVPNVSTLIAGIVPDGNTGTAQALWAGFQELVTLNEPGALNVVVLFTDGNPNGITANFRDYLKAATESSCALAERSLDKIGFIAQWGGARDPGPTVGVINPAAVSVSNTAENRVAPNSTGCAYASNVTNMRRDIVRIPDIDLYGNPTTGYRTVDLYGVDRPTQIVAASVNAADNAARRIRTDNRLRPVIYVIGLGGTSAEPLDEVFMKRVANDRTSPYHSDDEPTGLYILSPGTAQLQAAFQRISAEILRLAR